MRKVLWLIEIAVEKTMKGAEADQCSWHYMT